MLPFFADVVRSLATYLLGRPGKQSNDSDDAPASRANSAVDADIAGHVFRCLSRFFRVMSVHIFCREESQPVPALSTPQTDTRRQVEYRPGAIAVLKEHYTLLLGHKNEFVRSLAAESIAVLVRKLRGKALRAHLCQLGPFKYILSPCIFVAVLCRP